MFLLGPKCFSNEARFLFHYTVLYQDMTLLWFDDVPIKYNFLLSIHHLRPQLSSLWHFATYFPMVYCLKVHKSYTKYFNTYFIFIRLTFKVAQEDNANAVAIVLWRMRALVSPTSALVYISIAAYNKVVANVAEVTTALVVALNIFNQTLAGCFRITSIWIVGMMNNNIVHSTIDSSWRTCCHSSPAAAWFYINGIAMAYS